jgi:subtilase family serine protease
MSRSTRLAAALAGAAVTLATVALTVPGSAGASPGAPGAARVCAAHVPQGFATCFAQVRTLGAQPMTTKLASGYGPAQIRNAYNLPAGNHQTVAIVDAYNNPNAESDLAAYRANFGLPPCTTANGCFKKVNQTGGTTYPANNVGWGEEISLDIDMVSAACRSCHILLVEAKTASFTNLGIAVNYAATQGVAAISNSYGGSDTVQSAAYDHPGIAVTASTGDSGYGIQSPASYDSVIAVGGTSLHRATSTARGWRESAWSGAGSGCSTRNAKPSWQTAATQCSGKAAADVSAVADPRTGVAVYDTFGTGATWLKFGGTSASSPIIASVYAMGGNLSGYPASYTWAHTAGLYDVTAGSNGSCSPSVWCHAGVGWDGPTGLGTPNGTGSF